MPYAYTALDKTRKQIRLLTVLPGTLSSPISCSVSLVELEAKPEYEALSYEWGSPTGMRELLLEGKPFSVRSNLWLALSYLRHTKKSQTFWIDAICIDQTNILERNQQVGMMSDIYRNASIVRAWIGPESNTSAEAFKLLGRFKRTQTSGDNWKRAHKLSNYEREALFEFTNRSYWGRVWIVQELVLAQEIVFHCGEEDIVWSPSLLSSLRLVGFLHSPAGLILSLRDRRRTNSLLVLMRNCYSAQATDTRDKVFALLGIADDISPDTIPVDYTVAVDGLKKQVDKLYRRRELVNTPILWGSLGSSTTVDNMYDTDLGFSRYLDAYFHNPGLFGQIEQTRVLAVSTSYTTSVVKDKLRFVLSELESIEKFDTRRVDSGIVMEDSKYDSS